MVVRHFIGYAPNPGRLRRNQVSIHGIRSWKYEADSDALCFLKLSLCCCVFVWCVVVLSSPGASLCCCVFVWCKFLLSLSGASLCCASLCCLRLVRFGVLHLCVVASLSGASFSCLCRVHLCVVVSLRCCVFVCRVLRRTGLVRVRSSGGRTGLGGKEVEFPGLFPAPLFPRFVLFLFFKVAYTLPKTGPSSSQGRKEDLDVPESPANRGEKWHCPLLASSDWLTFNVILVCNTNVRYSMALFIVGKFYILTYRANSIYFYESILRV